MYNQVLHIIRNKQLYNINIKIKDKTEQKSESSDTIL